MDLERNKDVAIASFRLIESGDAEEARRIIADSFINREAEDDPGERDRNQQGAEGFLATGQWLRHAFADLRFEEIEVIAEGGAVVVRAIMTGRHSGVFQGIEPTGRRIRQRQIHVFHLASGKITEHIAQRDDLGLLLSLGWRSPVA